jgi:hypothetical protein
LSHTLKKGMRVLNAEFMMGRIRSTGKLVQRTFEVEGNKRTVVEIQVTHVGPDLQFATAEVAQVHRRRFEFDLGWVLGRGETKRLEDLT